MAYGGFAVKDYGVFVLSLEGLVIDYHEITCDGDEEAKARAKGLASINPVEVWDGPKIRRLSS